MTATTTTNKTVSGHTELTKRTEFRRPLNGGGYAVLMLNAGERVKYERRETDTEIIYTASIVMDGYTWRSVRRWEKECVPPTRTEVKAAAVVNNSNSVQAVKSVSPKPVPKPSAPKVMDETQKATAQAMKVIAGKGGVNGSDEMERKVNSLKGVCDALRGDIYMLQYDIPDRLKKKCPNPSHIFRHYGYRLNLSCWVMPVAGLESDAVSEVLDYWATVPVQVVQEEGDIYPRRIRVKFHKVKYAPDQLEIIRQIALEELDEELKRIHTALITRLGSASDALSAAEKALDEREGKGEEVTQKDLDKVQNTYVGALRGTLQEVIDCFEGALKSAEAFDQTEALADLFDGVRAAIRTEAMAINVQLRAEGRKEISVPNTLS